MFSSFFAWLRKKSAEAVLQGVNDAAREIENADDEKPAAALLWIGAPADEAEKPAVRRGKAS